MHVDTVVLLLYRLTLNRKQKKTNSRIKKSKQVNQKCNNKLYKNKKCTQTANKETTIFRFVEISASSTSYLYTLPYKRYGKAHEWVSEAQSALREESSHDLKISITKISRTIVHQIVILYAKDINKGIQNKAIVVVYIKLWAPACRILRIMKNF